MSTAVILITHEDIARSLLSTVNKIVNNTIENIISIEVPVDIDSDTVIKNINNKLAALNTDGGLLVLTDLVGSTPFNVASQIKDNYENAKLVTGLNLPILLKLYNYRTLPLTELTEKIKLAGQNGIHEY